MATTEFVGQAYGIYPRVSSPKQSEDDRISLDAQIEACQEYADELGMVLDAQCVRKEAHTATTSERPELEALLRDMVSRKVPNLVIDRVDRLTREGQVAAALYLKRFADANIVLHVVSMDAQVRPANASADIKNVLDLAYAAEQANRARMHSLQRARKAYARAGRYAKGGRPPYGYVFQPVAWDSKGNPTRYHLAADTRNLNDRGETPWSIRQRICREYLAGAGCWTIAQGLTRDGIPTSRTLAGQRHASPYWHATTIHDLLESPINHGVATSFRRKQQEALPDAKHTSRWKQTVDVPVEKQIAIPGIVLDPVITAQEAELIQARLRMGRERSRRNSKYAFQAMLHGGMARCGMVLSDGSGTVCGGSLRAKMDGRNFSRQNMWYTCRIHEAQPTKCPGVSIAVPTLDALVWADVMAHLLEPGAFQRAAEEQMALDTAKGLGAGGENPSAKLQRSQAVRADFVRRANNLRAVVATTDDAEMREQFLADLQQVNANIRQVDADLEGQARQAADWERKQAILGNIDAQVTRHIDLIQRLSQRVIAKTLTEADVRTMHTICESLGVEPMVAIDPDTDRYLVTVKFNLGAATFASWFPESEMEEVGNAEVGSKEVGSDAVTLNVSR